MELPITQQTIEEFLITLQSTELSAEFQITTNELCCSVIRNCSVVWRVMRNCSVVWRVIANSMHSSFVVIWNSVDNYVVCRVIWNSADSSVLCWVIRNCSVVLPSKIQNYRQNSKLPCKLQNYRQNSKLPQTNYA
jgi:hypothetical protein